MYSYVTYHTYESAVIGLGIGYLSTSLTYKGEGFLYTLLTYLSDVYSFEL